jgi:hypothetical protein
MKIMTQRLVIFLVFSRRPASESSEGLLAAARFQVFASNYPCLARVPLLPSIIFDVSMLSLLKYSLSLCFFVATFITFFSVVGAITVFVSSVCCPIS